MENLAQAVKSKQKFRDILSVHGNHCENTKNPHLIVSRRENTIAGLYGIAYTTGRCGTVCHPGTGAG